MRRGPDPRLQALLDDPLAHLSIPGAELVQRSTREPGEVLGKPVYARVTQVYRVADGDGEALDAAVVAAREAGWEVREGAFPDTYLARKQLPPGEAEATLALQESEGETRLSVVIHYAESGA